MASPISALFSRPLPLFTAAALLRAVMLVYGLWQDANSPLKYTDIDYMVFTDAARFTFSSSSPSSSLSSPYTRETYRYTPLLSWLLWPTTLPGPFWFSFGKVLFAAADLLAGWLLVLILRHQQRQQQQPPNKRTSEGGGEEGDELKYAAIWLLNPMVATISTRGSSEGLLGVLVTALLWAAQTRRSPALAGLLLGLGVHFKIYPFIYAPAVAWWMDGERMGRVNSSSNSSSSNSSKAGEKDPSISSPTAATTTTDESARLGQKKNLVINILTPERLTLAGVSLATFLGLNAIMYALYGEPFVTHTFLHHVSRVDHRHNFSPYNVLLYLASASAGAGSGSGSGSGSGIGIESLAFLPQLLLSTVLIPFVGAKKDLAATMLAQTFAFVTFNKVCTSQVCLLSLLLNKKVLPFHLLLPHL